MTVKILGVCGSPIKKGNTETLLNIVLESARETGGVDTYGLRRRDRAVGVRDADRLGTGV